jgi:hypothetical protein
MKKTDTTAIDQSRAVQQRSNARRTALIVGLIALSVYGGFLASVMVTK